MEFQLSLLKAFKSSFKKVWSNTKVNLIPTLCFAQLKFWATVLSGNMTRKRSFKSRHDLKEKLESTTFKTHLISALAAETGTMKLSSVEVDFLAGSALDAVEVLP